MQGDSVLVRDSGDSVRVTRGSSYRDLTVYKSWPEHVSIKSFLVNRHIYIYKSIKKQTHLNTAV